MHTNGSPFTITKDSQDDTAGAIEWEAIDFSRLVQMTDEVALIRLGLILMERVAQTEGRIFWR